MYLPQTRPPSSRAPERVGGRSPCREPESLRPRSGRRRHFFLCLGGAAPGSDSPRGSRHRAGADHAHAAHAGEFYGSLRRSAAVPPAATSDHAVRQASRGGPEPDVQTHRRAHPAVPAQNADPSGPESARPRRRGRPGENGSGQRREAQGSRRLPRHGRLPLLAGSGGRLGRRCAATATKAFATKRPRCSSMAAAARRRSSRH